MITTPQWPTRWRALPAGSLFLLSLVLGVLAAAETVQSMDPVIVEIAIRAREFRPSTVKIPIGRDVRLVFHNQDVELHAFVPKNFLENIPLDLDGPGAPEYGNNGLIRILIPSGGLEEIRFRLRSAGYYEYRCDLPGHQMVGRIIAE